jgi:hypothetical protein
VTEPNTYTDIIKPGDTDMTGKPHGWIQWKGTDVCIDLHCVCGHHGHFDGDFFYYYQCPACGARYAVGMNVALIPMTEQQAADHGIEFQTDTTSED